MHAMISCMVVWKGVLVVIWMLFFVGLLLPAGLLAACLFGILIQCVADL